jgi:hypothetical protein
MHFGKHALLARDVMIMCYVEHPWVHTTVHCVRSLIYSTCCWGGSTYVQNPPLCNENPIYVFYFWDLCDPSPNFHIPVSVSDLYIPRIGPHISLQQNSQTDPGNIEISHRYECRNLETEHYNSVLEIRSLYSFISGNT